MFLVIPSFNSSFMQSAKLLAATFFLVSSVSLFAAPPAQLTREQQEQLEARLDNVEQQCLQGAILQSFSLRNGQTSEAMKMMSSATSDPGFCSCMKTGFRVGMTPEVFAMDQEEATKYIGKLSTKIMHECLAPLVVEKFADSCEKILSDLANAKPVKPDFQQDMESIGASSPSEYMGRMCGCIRPALKGIAPSEFMDSTIAAYKAHEDRARNGGNAKSAKPDVIDNMFSGCLTQLQTDYKAANKQAGEQMPAK